MNIDDTEVEELTTEGELLIDSILANEPLDVIKKHITDGAPIWYQNRTEGISALHAAAYIQNAPLVAFLISSGAVWNAGEWPDRQNTPNLTVQLVNDVQHTAGDIALSLNNKEIYTMIRDAGLRTGWHPNSHP